jgi:hypothetical protein
VLLDAANLFALQLRTEGEHQGAFLFPDLAREAQSPSGFQAGVFEWLKFLAWESQQVGKVRRYQGADKVETTAVEELLIAGRVVALIKDQGDGLAVAGQGLIALGEFLQDLDKGDAVMLIAGVNLPQQGDMKVDAHQQGQADDAEVASFAFGVTAPRQLAGIFRVDEGIEVRAIEDQAVDIQLAGLEQALGEGLADGGDLLLPE